MLKNLYRKLHTIFFCSIMLIITAILALIFTNAFHTERINEGTLFQRMTTLMIYQIETHPKDMKATFQDYENEYRIFSQMKNLQGKTIYQSKLSFPTNAETILAYWKTAYQAQTSSVLSSENNKNATTSQDGFYEIKGTGHDSYLVIPAMVVTANNQSYEAVFIYQTKTISDFLWENLFFYLSVWMISFILVILLTGILLKKALSPTEKMLQSQKEFVAAASHELKSPLAVIMAYTDVLQSENLTDKTSKQAAAAIDSECTRLSRLVRELLLLASSDAKTWTIQKQKTDVDTLLITLYELYEPACVKNNISLHLELSDETYPPFITDKDRLLELLSILMDNAIQHSNGTPSIEIKAVEESRHIKFLIIDHGQGVPDEEKKRIFERFYSGDKSHTNKSNFGLGLSIAKEMTNMLNGTIEISDTPGGGATFAIRFPICRPLSL